MSFSQLRTVRFTTFKLRNFSSILIFRGKLRNLAFLPFVEHFLGFTCSWTFILDIKLSFFEVWCFHRQCLLGIPCVFKAKGILNIDNFTLGDRGRSRIRWNCIYLSKMLLNFDELFVLLGLGVFSQGLVFGLGVVFSIILILRRLWPCLCLWLSKKWRFLTPFIVFNTNVRFWLCFEGVLPNWASFHLRFSVVLLLGIRGKLGWLFEETSFVFIRLSNRW